MERVISTVIDKNRAIVGLIFDEKGNRRVEGIKSLINRGYKNHQIEIQPGLMRELGKFKLNEIQMLMFDNGVYTKVSNSMALKSRIEADDKVIGFEVEFDTCVSKCRYNNVINMSVWHKPENFVVKTSVTGKAFVAGRPNGVKIDELPAIYIDTNRTKKAKSGAQVVAKSTNLENIVDIQDIFTEVKSLGGLVVNLPSERYQTITERKTKVSGEFESLGAGEYAYPELEVSQKGLNVNVAFRKPGVVELDLGNAVMTNVHAFVHSKKTVFKDCESHIKRLGVAIPEAKEADFLGRLVKTMAIDKMKDTTLIKIVTALTGKKGMAFYEIDTSKVDAIDKRKFNTYKLGLVDLKASVEGAIKSKLATKFLSPTHGLISALKKELGSAADSVTQRQPLPIYGALSSAFQKKLIENGIDIYTGAFLKKVEVQQTDKGKERVDEIKESKVTIDYFIDGWNMDNWSFSKINEQLQKGTELPQDFINTMVKLLSISNKLDMLREAIRLYEIAELEQDKFKKKMWLHKSVMYTIGNKTNIHIGEGDKWVFIPAKGKRNYNLYKCAEPGCESLRLAVENVEVG